MIPEVSQWRSTERYDYIEQLMSPELAWEWLRRNEAYQRDYAAILSASKTPESVIESVLQRWGPRFPD